MALLGLAAAVLVAVLVGGAARSLGARLALFDHPDESGLKPHPSPVVPLGGAAVFLGLHAGLAIAGSFDVALLVATSLIWILGLADDVRQLSPLSRLLGTLGIGLLLGVLGDYELGALGLVGAAVLVVIVVNAVNLIDGLDGLSGSVTALGTVGLAIHAANVGVSDAWAPLMLGGALVGFLYWNVAPARLFLGDNGAYVVGVALSWAVLRSSPDLGESLVGLVVIGIPLVDMASTIIRRLIGGSPLFAGDRDHTYDRLIASGWSIARVVSTFAALQVVWMSSIILIDVSFGNWAAVLTSIGLGLLFLSWSLAIGSREEDRAG